MNNYKQSLLLRSKSGIIHLLPLILVGGLIVAVIGGIFYFNQNNDQPLITQSSPPQISEIETEKMDTENWISYTNDYGYTIQYPTNFITKAYESDVRLDTEAVPSSAGVEIINIEDNEEVIYVDLHIISGDFALGVSNNPVTQLANGISAYFYSDSGQYFVPIEDGTKSESYIGIYLPDVSNTELQNEIFSSFKRSVYKNEFAEWYLIVEAFENCTASRAVDNNGKVSVVLDDGSQIETDEPYAEAFEDLYFSTAHKCEKQIPLTTVGN